MDTNVWAVQAFCGKDVFLLKSKVPGSLATHTEIFRSSYTHPRKLTWNPKMEPISFEFHVRFRGWLPVTSIEHVLSLGGFAPGVVAGFG